MDGWTALPIAFGDGAAEEFKERTIVRGEIAKLVGLEDGTTGGNPSVGFFIELPDHELVFVETTWRLFDAAHAACEGRFGSIRT